eukprot:6489761-Amphidinium_carterae.1
MFRHRSPRSAVWRSLVCSRWIQVRSLQCLRRVRSKLLEKKRCRGELQRLPRQGSKGSRNYEPWQVCTVNGTCWTSLKRQLTMWASAKCAPQVCMAQEHHRAAPRFPEDKAWCWRNGYRWQPAAAVKNGGAGLVFRNHVAAQEPCWSTPDERMLATMVNGFGAQEVCVISVYLQTATPLRA